MAKTWVYNDLSATGALTLVIDDVTYEVAQFSCAYAVNEIPSASCMLAVGRNALTGVPAAIHANAQFSQMTVATVYFNPQQEYSQEADWPAGPHIIFFGFLAGFAYRKINGKIQVVASLVHWSAALGFSSCLNGLGFTANPAQMNAAAALSSLTTDGAAGQTNLVSMMVPHTLTATNVLVDFWAALKTVFSAMANTKAMNFGPNQCGGTPGETTVNSAALMALARIEGITNVTNTETTEVGAAAIAALNANNTDVPYVWGVPLTVGCETDTKSPLLAGGLTDDIGEGLLVNWAAASFWDKLVGEYCPKYGMAFVPRAIAGLVIADTPALGDPLELGSDIYWKYITGDEYSEFDMSATLHRPLRGVGVLSRYVDSTKAGLTERGASFVPANGCFVADSVTSGDGMVKYVMAASWLQALASQSTAGDSTGVNTGGASPTATQPGVNVPLPPNGTADQNAGTTQGLYTDFAHLVYVTEMLRGRNGSLSGKLRFDIAPGSIVKIANTTEKFIEGDDDRLALTLYGYVHRVSIAINAEAGMAGTTLSLSYLRTEAENQDLRTSVDAHPLFCDSIHGGGKHGSPLVDLLNFDPDDDDDD